MEGDTSTATNGGLNIASAPVAANSPQASEASNSSPVPSTAGELQSEDEKGALKATDEAEGIGNIYYPTFLLVACVD